jgi:hypothetical protein
MTLLELLLLGLQCSDKPGSNNSLRRNSPDETVHSLNDIFIIPPLLSLLSLSTLQTRRYLICI